MSFGNEILTFIDNNSHSVNKEFERFLDQLEKFNKEITKSANKVYLDFIDTLAYDKEHFINSYQNFTKLQDLTKKMERLQTIYRKKYPILLNKVRRKSFEYLKERDVTLKKILNNNGVDDFVLMKETSATKFLSKTIVNKGLKEINNTLVKWNNYTYDTFFDAIAQQTSIKQLKKKLYDKDGKLKIGSTLEGETSYTMMNTVTTERTTFIDENARDSGYDYCWNANPMDAKTKPICMAATLAGVIPFEKMQADYNLPPRWICRCAIIYSRGHWKTYNRAVNASLEEKRLQLIEELRRSKRKPESWETPKGVAYRRKPDMAGKMYKIDKERLKTALENKVPELEWYTSEEE